MRTLLVSLSLSGLFVITLIIVACSGGEVTTSIAPTVTTQTQTITTQGIPEPPLPEELAKQGYALPELSRITSEQLKQMMDNKEPFLLVDVRISYIFDQGNLPQSITIPHDLSGGDLIDRLMLLPRDKPVIFYCD